MVLPNVPGQPRDERLLKTENGRAIALRFDAFHEKACRLNNLKWFTILVIDFAGLEQIGVPGSQASIRTRFGGVNVRTVQVGIRSFKVRGPAYWLSH